MAKRQKRNFNLPTTKRTSSSDKSILYTTSSGEEVILQPVSPFALDNAVLAFPLPDPPTYEVETATGEIEIHEHDETTLESDEDHIIWDEYQHALKEANDKSSDASLKLIILRGIVLTESQNGAMQNWEEELTFLGMSIPETKSQKRFMFVQEIILSNTDDLAEIMSLIIGMSGADEEMVREAEESFRSAMEGTPANGDQDKEE